MKQDHLVQFFFNLGGDSLYYSYAEDAVYSLSPNQRDEEKDKMGSQIPFLVAGLGSLISGVGVFLTYKFSHYDKGVLNGIALLLFFVILLLELWSIGKRRTNIDGHVRKNGHTILLSDSEFYRLVKASAVSFRKCSLFALILLLVSAFCFFLYATEKTMDLRALIVAAIGLPTGIALLLFFEPIQKERLLCKAKKRNCTM